MGNSAHLDFPLFERTGLACPQLDHHAIGLTNIQELPDQPSVLAFLRADFDATSSSILDRPAQLYCSHCKNWMITRPQGLDFLVNVRATMLEHHRWYVPFIEVYTSEKLPWAFTGAAHSFATQPELEKYQPLINAFAREGARPA